MTIHIHFVTYLKSLVTCLPVEMKRLTDNLRRYGFPRQAIRTDEMFILSTKMYRTMEKIHSCHVREVQSSRKFRTALSGALHPKT